MSQVRVSENTHKLLRSLSAREGKSMQDIIDKAIEEYRRKTFLEGLSNDYLLLRENPEVWKEHQEDMALWENTLMDGLENE
jgi:7-keto-8-aminopelargonate synthetase-like enzyme